MGIAFAWRHGGGRRHKRHGGNDDLVPGFHTHRSQRRLQRHGAVGHGNAVGSVLERGKVALEPSHLGVVLVFVAAPPPDAALQHALQQGLLFVAKNRPGLAERFRNCR